MNAQDIPAIVSVVMAAGSALGVFYLGAIKIAKLEAKVDNLCQSAISPAEFAALSLKADTLWTFQMRRAVSEAVATGIGSLNSPLRFSEEARKRLDPIKDQLVRFWQAQELDGKPALDAAMALENEFGEIILKDVCIPCKLTHGACLLLALAVAQQRDELVIH